MYPKSSSVTTDEGEDDIAERLKDRLEQLTSFSQAVTQRYASLCADYRRLAGILNDRGVNYRCPPGVGVPLPDPPEGVSFKVLTQREACIKIQAAYRGWLVRRNIEVESECTVRQSAVRRRSMIERGAGPAASSVEYALRGDSSDSSDLVSKRDRIADEIMKTEKVYLTSLKLLVKVFKVPLVYAATSAEPIIPMDACTQIFSNVETIYKMHEDFYKELTGRWNMWEENNSLGDVFLAFTPFLKMYTQYSRNYGDSLRLVKELRVSDPKFKAFLEARTKIKSLNNLTIDSLLIMPIQRIPRYKLLLLDFKKNTPEDHPDLADLEKALALMEEVAVVVDNAIIKHENLSLAAHVQQSIQNCPPLIAPGRRYLREGPCTFPNASSFLTKKGYLFLFNNLLIVTKVKVQLGKKDEEAKFTLKAQLPLSTVHVVDVPLAKAPTFQIQGASMTLTFDISMTTPELRDEWVGAITTAADEIRHADKEAAISRLEAKSCYGGETLLLAKNKIEAMLSAAEEYSLRPLSPAAERRSPTGDDEAPPPMLMRDRPPRANQAGAVPESGAPSPYPDGKEGSKNLQKTFSSKMQKVLAKKGKGGENSKSMYIPSPSPRSPPLEAASGVLSASHPASLPRGTERGAVKSMYHSSSGGWGGTTASRAARRGGRRADFLGARKPRAAAVELEEQLDLASAPIHRNSRAKELTQMVAGVEVEHKRE